MPFPCLLSSYDAGSNELSCWASSGSGPLFVYLYYHVRSGVCQTWPALFRRGKTLAWRAQTHERLTTSEKENGMKVSAHVMYVHQACTQTLAGPASAMFWCTHSYSFVFRGLDTQVSGVSGTCKSFSPRWTNYRWRPETLRCTSRFFNVKNGQRSAVCLIISIEEQ